MTQIRAANRGFELLPYIERTISEIIDIGFYASHDQDMTVLARLRPVFHNYSLEYIL